MCRIESDYLVSVYALASGGGGDFCVSPPAFGDHKRQLGIFRIENFSLLRSQYVLRQCLLQLVNIHTHVYLNCQN